MLNPSPALADSLAAAARALAGVLSGTRVSVVLDSVHPPALRRAAQDLSFNALRAYGFVDRVVELLVVRSTTAPALKGLLMAAIAELISRPTSAHTVVHQAVEAAPLLGEPRARGLVNGVLRTFLRQANALGREIGETEPGRLHYPQWWINRVRAAFPTRWESILSAANAHPPMTLRVNARSCTVPEYLARLHRSGISARAVGGVAVRLDQPCRVDALPGFREGAVSVQDKGAQTAAALLDVQNDMRVLDACAAPGGKACHILETVDCQLLAIDLARDRAAMIRDNFSRLGLDGRVQVADAMVPESFWDGVPYDRILADVPCSASGVVRRHPDIRWLRRESDLQQFADQQRRLLRSLWPLLRPGGLLLYATCSVFPEENDLQVRGFLAERPDATALPLSQPPEGLILPAPETDGFYYAVLRKGLP